MVTFTLYNLTYLRSYLITLKNLHSPCAYFHLSPPSLWFHIFHSAYPNITNDIYTKSPKIRSTYSRRTSDWRQGGAKSHHPDRKWIWRSSRIIKSRWCLKPKDHNRIWKGSDKTFWPSSIFYDMTSGHENIIDWPADRLVHSHGVCYVTRLGISRLESALMESIRHGLILTDLLTCLLYTSQCINYTPNNL